MISIDNDCRVVASDFKKIKENQGKISNIRKDLDEFSKNPNFYRNKKIMAVAASVVIIAAVAVASYFTFALGTPFFVATITGYSPSGLAGGAILMMMTTPLLGLASLGTTVPNIFKTHQKDESTLQDLEQENAHLRKNCESKMTNMRERLGLYERVCADEYSDEAWQSMKKLLAESSLNAINGDEKKKAIWLGKQQDLEESRAQLKGRLNNLVRLEEAS